MRGSARLLVAIGAVAILLAALLLCLALHTDESERPPIVIDGNADFIPKNGVIDGDGTPSNPYVIEDWRIVFRMDYDFSFWGIRIVNTSAHFLIRHVEISGGRASAYEGTGFHAGIVLRNVSNGTIEDAVVNGCRNGIQLFRVTDCTIRNCYVMVAESGVYVNGIQCNVSGNSISLCRYEGAEISNSVNCTFSFNHVRDSRDGLLLSWSSDIKVIDNEFTNITESGVAVRRSVEVEIKGNSFDSGGVVLHHSGMAEASSHRTLIITADNLLLGRPVLFLANAAEHTIADTEVGQLILVNCSRMRISGVQFLGGFTAAQVLLSANITLDNCSVGGGAVEVRERHKTGVQAEYCDNLTVREITVSYRLVGMKFVSCYDVIIVGNAFVNNLVGLELNLTSRSIVYHNNFIDNDIQARDVEGDGNKWQGEYPWGGNYWSSYMGEDMHSGPDQDVVGPDGIGDTPYTIDEVQADRYPLMAPITLSTRSS